MDDKLLATATPVAATAQRGDDGGIDVFVPDTVLLQELSVTAMSVWRWDNDPHMVAMGLPPPIRLGRRKFRSRAAIEKFKRALIQRALDERARGGARHQKEEP